MATKEQLKQYFKASCDKLNKFARPIIKQELKGKYVHIMDTYKELPAAGEQQCKREKYFKESLRTAEYDNLSKEEQDKQDHDIEHDFRINIYKNNPLFERRSHCGAQLLARDKGKTPEYYYFTSSLFEYNGKLCFTLREDQINLYTQNKAQLPDYFIVYKLFTTDTGKSLQYLKLSGREVKLWLSTANHAIFNNYKYLIFDISAKNENWLTADMKDTNEHIDFSYLSHVKYSNVTSNKTVYVKLSWADLGHTFASLSAAEKYIKHELDSGLYMASVSHGTLSNAAKNSSTIEVKGDDGVVGDIFITYNMNVAMNKATEATEESNEIMETSIACKEEEKNDKLNETMIISEDDSRNGEIGAPRIITKLEDLLSLGLEDYMSFKSRTGGYFEDWKAYKKEWLIANNITYIPPKPTAKIIHNYKNKVNLF